MSSFFGQSNTKIHYRLIGKGECIVLIHGYLETLEIWNDFAEELSKSYRVLTFDMPGHGMSDELSECNSVEGMATIANEILMHLEISKAVIVGHSMGGYIALAFAELFPSSTAGLCLFHSTPFADGEQKKSNRMNEIELILKGEKKLIVEDALPLRFANMNLMKFRSEVNRAKAIALDISDGGVVATLKAMVSRPDRNHVFQKANFPTMMIFGMRDNHISLDVASDLANRHKNTRTVYLNNSGHMGFIEEKGQALVAIKSFLECVFS